MSELLIRDVLLKDPARAIANDGVVKVDRPLDDDQWSTLRKELETFVLDGDYGNGFRQILETYLKNIDHTPQTAAWVSGFFGSGKSHLVRMLATLWENKVLPDGAQPRSLVYSMPDEIRADLIELSNRSRPYGLLALTGQFSENQKFGKRNGSLAILLQLVMLGIDLPAEIGPGLLQFWLRSEGIEDQIKADLSAKKRIFKTEILNFAMSDTFAEALLKARPNFASDIPAAKQTLREQYPASLDPSEDTIKHYITQMLKSKSPDGTQIPLTVIVADEVQQYIGSDGERSLQIQNIAEWTANNLNGHVLFVATGQAALTDTADLSKLQARFTTRVRLNDEEVHSVIRKVVLDKQASAAGDLKSMLDRVQPEINRDLPNTDIRPRSDDQADLPAMYPLLPARQRFWETILRTTDRQGGVGARSQLRIVQIAVEGIADRPLGTVIAGDALYDIKRDDFLSASVLPVEVRDRIAALEREGADGRLRARILKLVFLISKIPTGEIGDPNVRANADTLAGLLTDDFNTGSNPLRQNLQAVLDQLVSDGDLLKLTDTYALQTSAGRDWRQAFQAAKTRLQQSRNEIANERHKLSQDAVRIAIGAMKVQHGVAKESRSIDLTFADNEPVEAPDRIQVWVRDRSQVGQTVVEQDARGFGPESARVLVWIPDENRTELDTALIEYLAAKETIDQRPKSDLEAETSMQSTMGAAKRQVDQLITQRIRESSVYLGGGTTVSKGDFIETVRAAVTSALDRAYPAFGEADSIAWSQIAEKARKGNSGALSQIGYSGKAEDHPVLKAVLGQIGAGKKGSELRTNFGRRPYGWPQDAVDAALLVLIANDQAWGETDGKRRNLIDLVSQQIGNTTFKRNNNPLTASERIALSGWVSKYTGKSSDAVTLDQDLVTALDRLRERAAMAGGESPFPAPPSPTEVSALINAAPGERQRLVLDARTRLDELNDQWTAAAKTIAARKPEWDKLNRLLALIGNEPGTEGIQQAVDSIAGQRSLLQSDDPLPNLIGQATDIGRNALNAAHQQLVEGRTEQVAILEQTPEWTKLSDAQWQQIFAGQQITEPAPPSVGTTNDVIAELATAPLATRRSQAIALESLFGRARQDAARILRPAAVRYQPIPRTLESETDVEQWIADTKADLLERIKSNPQIV